MPAHALMTRTAIVCVALALAGCNFAPKYKVPETPVATAFKETGDWSPAAPADTITRDGWWQAFNDPVLNDLQARLVAQSPSLAAAVARYDQADAALSQAGASLFPSLDARGSAVRARLSGRRPLPPGAAMAGPLVYQDYVAGLAASYELDLWGRVRNLVSAGKAARDASAADLASVRLSLQVQCANTYFLLRGFEAQLALLDGTVDAFDRARALTEARHEEGSASGLDVGRSRTQLFNARALRTEVAANRALAEHALAALVGESASLFALAPAPAEIPPVKVPVSAPSHLLQRRPDIAAAERRMAAANARVGVQRAAFFPTVGLSATGGYEATHGALLSAPASYWALGPAAGVLNLFDGGQRRASVDVAFAAFDETAAQYRTTVLGAFREVEDQLTLVNRLAVQAADQGEAVVASSRTARLAETRYNEGAASYLEVVTAQTAELDARRAALNLNTRRLQAGVDLIRALGGGWTAETPVAENVP